MTGRKVISKEELLNLYKKENNNTFYLGIKTPLTLRSSQQEDLDFKIFYLSFYTGSLFLLLSRYFEDLQGLAIFILWNSLLDLIYQVKKEFESNHSVINSISRVLGRIIFCKTMTFRNIPSWDVAVIMTLIPFLPVLFMTLAFTTKSEHILSVLAPYIAFLWNLMSRKSALYKACYDTYNKYLEKSVSTKEDEKEGVEILRSSLVIDVLDLDLWAHKSFSELFIFELVHSLEYIGEQNAYHLLPPDYLQFYIANQQDSMDFSKKRFCTYLESNNLLIQDVAFILNLTFQIRNINHKSGTSSFKNTEKMSEELAQVYRLTFY